MDIASNNKIRLVFQDGTNTYVASSVSTIGTAWTHVAVVHDAGYTYFYINGALDT